MANLNYLRTIQADFVNVMTHSKAYCLAKDDKPQDFPMIALERDEDYMPTFKDCVKDTMM